MCPSSSFFAILTLGAGPAKRTWQFSSIEDKKQNRRSSSERRFSVQTG
jgi:hypothetical protein